MKEVNKPVIQPSGGTFDTRVTVQITCRTKNARIHYTTDGSRPTQKSTLYVAPIVLEAE